MLKMGASMDPAALKTGVLAHSQAIATMDSKGVADACGLHGYQWRMTSTWTPALQRGELQTSVAVCIGFSM